MKAAALQEARRLDALGLALQDEGRFRDSEPVLKKAAALAEETLGPDDPEVATLLNNLAVSYKYLARYSEAGQLYQRSLAILRRKFGPNHAALATLYAHQSVVLVKAGDVITRGQLIGAVGCTGICTGAHLHFEVRVNGVPVDPLVWL